MTVSTTGLIPRLLLAATATLAVAGFYGGLARIGVPLPYADAPSGLHGVIMMQGVFGTLVPLERAVALRTPAWLVGPALSILATASLIAGAPELFGLTLFAMSAVLFCCMSAYVVRLQPASFTLALFLGSASLKVAAIENLVNDGDVTSAVPWWLSFLVLTVAGERLELSRLMGHGRGSVTAFFGAATVLLAGAAMGFDRPSGPLVYGIGLMLLAAWLLRFDIAHRTIRMQGKARFMGVAILCGHAWLAVAAIVAFALPSGAGSMDALIHTITIGFGLSMVMGHALIILPAVAGVAIQYSPSMFVPLLLLQASVAWRIVADALVVELRWSAGVFAVLALAAFVAFAVRNARKATA